MKSIELTDAEIKFIKMCIYKAMGMWTNQDCTRNFHKEDLMASLFKKLGIEE